MYNLNADEILLVDGGGDGGYNGQGGGSMSSAPGYGGQGGGFVGTQSNGRNLGSSCGLAIAGAAFGIAGMIGSGGFSGAAAISAGLGAASSCRN